MEPEPTAAAPVVRQQAERRQAVDEKNEERLREVWSRSDADGSGELDVAVVREIGAVIAPRHKTREFRASVDVMLEEAGSETITFDDFLDWWRSHAGDEAVRRDFLPCDTATRKLLWVSGFSPFDCNGRCGCCSTPELLDADDMVVDPAAPVPAALRKSIDGVKFGALVLELNDVARHYTTPGMQRLIFWSLLLAGGALSGALLLACGLAADDIHPGTVDDSSSGSSVFSWSGEDLSTSAATDMKSGAGELCLKAFDSSGGRLTDAGLKWTYIACVLVLASGLVAALACQFYIRHWREPRVDTRMRVQCAEHTSRNDAITWKFRTQDTSGCFCYGRYCCRGRYKYVAAYIAPTEGSRIGRFLTVAAPEDADPGQTILVRNPDSVKPRSHALQCGCDRCIGVLRVAIPPGVAPGSEFQVQLPSEQLHNESLMPRSGAANNRP